MLCASMSRTDSFGTDSLSPRNPISAVEIGLLENAEKPQQDQQACRDTEQPEDESFSHRSNTVLLINRRLW